MRILVVGKAGYIGSHTAEALARAGHEVTVLDTLRRGHSWAVRWGDLIEMDLADCEGLRRTFERRGIDAVLHCAALAYVEESIAAPAEYFRNNAVGTLNLLDAMREGGTSRIVFSSSCATYGNPERTPIDENHPQRPLSPYGRSKLAVEGVLRWHGEAYDLLWAALRYFNAAGADPDGEIGEAHDPETHIPRAIAGADGDAPPLKLLGIVYDTPDGTAVRDYIHVSDLASAHVRALKRLAAGNCVGPVNLGTGCGHLVREIVAAVERAVGRKVPVETSPRRTGDASSLVADGSRVARELGWTPQHSSLSEIVEPASDWYRHFRSPAFSARTEPISLVALSR